jgi:dTDP-4-dehydrorhamnose reductase
MEIHTVLVVGDTLLANQIVEYGKYVSEQMGVENTYYLSGQRDVLDYGQLIDDIAEHDPDYIINAWCDPDANASHVHLVERNPTASFQQAIGAGQVAIAARSAGVRLLHVSSNYVFGWSGLHRSSEEPNPSSAIGMACLWAERVVQAYSDEYLIVRLGWLYGPNRLFSYPYLTAMTSQENESLKEAGGKRVCYVPENQLGTPTYDREAATLIALHAVSPFGGGDSRKVRHLAPEGMLSWFQFCSMVGECRGSKEPIPNYVPAEQGLVPDPGFVCGPYHLSVATFLNHLG